MVDRAVQVEGPYGLSVKVLAPADMLIHNAIHLFMNDELRGGLRDVVDFRDLFRHFVDTHADFEQRLLRRALIESALEISGRDPEALLYAALVANELGDVDAALQALEEMVEANPAFRLYIVDDPDLKSLEGNARFDRLANPDAAGQ